MYHDIKITTLTTNGTHAVEGDGSRIVCPHCACEQTHLRRVEAGTRKEDRDAEVFRIDMQEGDPRVAHRPADQCIGRRDWLSLSFDCEYGCQFTLVLAQHKGDTFVNVLEEERFRRVT